ncbi:MAG: Cys-Gln thioester bond-forming surface protein, partial [Actinobacteria bacterium]|nr:Cys-Gln thioester bond-forming surface protein [Actinomycetota bacterium]
MTVTSLGAGGAFNGGTTPAGPDETIGTADDFDPYPWISFGGLILGQVQGSDGSLADTATYCIDITTGIGIGDSTDAGSWLDAVSVTLPDSRPSTLTLDGLATIASIVTNNYPSDDSLVPLAGTDNDKALAVQWAVWHYANGFEPGTAIASQSFGALGTYVTDPPTVLANYNLIVQSADNGVYPPVAEPEAPYLEIVEPVSQVAGTNGLVGPYAIMTNGGPVTLTVDGDAQIVDEFGEPLAGPFMSGDQVYLTKPTVGTAMITAEAEITTDVASTFVTASVQRLINASAFTSTYSTAAQASFVESVSVGDFVWLDSNRDGLQDVGEDGIAGVVMTLSGPNGEAVYDVAGNYVAPLATDVDGGYLFTGLPALPRGESYTVSIDYLDPSTELALGGLVPTVGQAGAVEIDSSTDSATSAADLSVDGASDLTLDFGF